MCPPQSHAVKATGAVCLMYPSALSSEPFSSGCKRWLRHCVTSPTLSWPYLNSHHPKAAHRTMSLTGGEPQPRSQGAPPRSPPVTPHRVQVSQLLLSYPVQGDF